MGTAKNVSGGMSGGADRDPYFAAATAVKNPTMIIAMASAMPSIPNFLCSPVFLERISQTCVTKKPIHKVISNPWTCTDVEGSGGVPNATLR